LYHGLFGKQHAPKPYMFLTERMQDPHGQTHASKEWTYGKMAIYPLPPAEQAESSAANAGQSEARQAAQALRLLSFPQEAVKVIDVGSHWHNPSVQMLCNIADAVIVAADAIPSKFNSARSRGNMKQITAIKDSGK